MRRKAVRTTPKGPRSPKEMLPDILKDHAVAAAMEAALPDAITGVHAERNEPTLWIEPAGSVEVCRSLKAKQNFKKLGAFLPVICYRPVRVLKWCTCCIRSLATSGSG